MVKHLKTEKIETDFNLKLLRSFFEHPNGNKVKRDIVDHPGAVVILPIKDNGNLLAIRQYRHALQEEIIEFPAGTLETGEAPLETAKREIQEEVGYKAETWVDLGTLYTCPGFCNEIMYCFLAKDLSLSKLEADEDELIEVIELSKEDCAQKIKDGVITDSKTISLFYKYLYE